MRRHEHLAESLKNEIAEIVGFELDDPRLETVTVTDVELASDNRDARVYVLVRGTEDEIQSALKALRRAASFVRQQVAMNLSLHHTPHVSFVRDTAEENASRVSEILEELDVKGEIRNKVNSE